MDHRSAIVWKLHVLLRKVFSERPSVYRKHWEDPVFSEVMLSSVEDVFCQWNARRRLGKVIYRTRESSPFRGITLGEENFLSNTVLAHLRMENSIQSFTVQLILKRCIKQQSHSNNSGLLSSHCRWKVFYLKKASVKSFMSKNSPP